MIGKMKEMSEFLKIATVDEILPGRAKMVDVGGKEVAVFNVAGSFYAIDNNCTHVGGPLCEGEIDGCEVTCPWHGAVFDVTSGQPLGPPASQPVTRYDLRVNGADIEIQI